jgi:excisionase family DNA binding protein
LLAVPERFSREKARSPVTAQVGDDHSVALRSQQRRNIDVTVNVVGPAVQENDRRTIGGASLRVTDVQETGLGGAQAWLDVDGAAKHLNCPRSGICSLVSARRIPFHKDGSRLLFDRAELDVWVRAGGGTRP